jgi:aspartate carbamoyltransferase catalytic subunit
LETLATQEIEKILAVAGKGAHWLEEDAPKTDTLRGRVIMLGFLEPSTRTRVSFEIAGKRLGADTINLSSGGSSLEKGETLLDTVLTLESMGVACLVLRHPGSRAPQELADRVQNMAIVNGGDGSREHPTQALLDVLAMRRYGLKLSGLKVALVGDIAYSRVARSNIYALTALGAEVMVCGPPSLLPQGLEEMTREPGSVQVTWNLEDALRDAGAVIALRLQRERQESGLIPSISEYVRRYQINPETLRVADPECVVLHPGPMNREVEIDSRVADGPRSLIRQQVTAGVAVRCAVLERACRVGSWQGEVKPVSTEDQSSMEAAQS